MSEVMDEAMDDLFITEHPSESGRRYVVHLCDKLGEGAFSEAYLGYDAMDADQESPVVLKFLRKKHQASINRDIALLRLAQHPTVVRLVDFRVSLPGPYLVTEYFPQTLAQVAKQREITQELVVAYLQWMVPALEWLAEHNTS